MILGISLNIWVKWVIQKHSSEQNDINGSGLELANHLIETANLATFRAESGKLPDHYDPQTKKIQLHQDRANHRSLASVVIAAHEFGHALQDAQDYKPLEARTLLIKILMPLDAVVNLVLLLSPALILFTSAPAALRAVFVIVIGTLTLKMLVHLVTLPVEFDASFNKALPILEQGGYLQEHHMNAAREILWAAALTYVAGALSSAFNIFFWLRILR